MKVVVYSRESWGEKVSNLFKAIYPEWSPPQCERMAYDETLPLHLVTLLAVTNNDAVGQVNVFSVTEGAELANVGYHVHPQWRRRGIGSLLLYEALARSHAACTDGLVIQTHKSNEASWKLAEKAGFRPASDDLIQKYSAALRFHSQPDGICLHLPRMADGPSKALERAALSAASGV